MKTETRDKATESPDKPSRVGRTSWIRKFSEIGIEDVPIVGGKTASLGEMFRKLSPKGVKVPDGFAITAEAYRDFLGKGGLDRKIDDLLGELDTRNLEALRECGAKIREAILATSFPDALRNEILARLRSACAQAATRRGRRSQEQRHGRGFAGSQFCRTTGNVSERSRTARLIDACRRCFASLFTDRAISYRADKGFDHHKIALSIAVQRMVRSDLGASGIMFTIDTETGFRDAVLINAAYGLGENVVQGSVTPDEYYVFKPTLKDGFRPILQKTIGSKEFKLIYDVGGGKMVKNVPVPPGDRNRFAISDDDILTLARWACMIEDHYSAIKGGPTPMDTEWAKDGQTGELFIVQARPETVESRRDRDVLESYRTQEARTGSGQRAAVSDRRSRPDRCTSSRARITSVNFRRAKFW